MNFQNSVLRFTARISPARYVSRHVGQEALLPYKLLFIYCSESTEFYLLREPAVRAQSTNDVWALEFYRSTFCSAFILFLANAAGSHLVVLLRNRLQIRVPCLQSRNLTFEVFYVRFGFEISLDFEFSCCFMQDLCELANTPLCLFFDSFS